MKGELPYPSQVKGLTGFGDMNQMNQGMNPGLNYMNSGGMNSSNNGPLSVNESFGGATPDNLRALNQVQDIVPDYFL